MSGNEALAAGALAAGCRFYAGYPITPQNELVAYLARHMPEQNGVFIQAESEVSAVNMVYGASAAGARAMTSSSSPGISLKQEGISYLAGAQLPAVIVNIMRGGPGLGNIAPAQSDYFQATRGGGHGDYHTPVLAPDSVQECYDCMSDAFGLADRYRTPVLILGDGMLGQMREPVAIHKLPARTSKAIKSWALKGCRGRKAQVVKSFFMREGELRVHNRVLQEKYQSILRSEQRWEESFLSQAEVVVVAYGMMARIVREAVLALRKQRVRVGMIRPLSLWPFPRKPFMKLMRKQRKLSLLVVEMSAGQMCEDVRLSVEGRLPVSFLGWGGGGVSSVEQIMKVIRRLQSK